METVDQISDIVDLMIPTVTIDSVVDNGDGTQTITACNTYWARKYMTLTIGGTDYIVDSFSQDVSITIPDTPAITATSFTMPKPYYYHGTPIQVNNEWIIERTESSKYPLVYLVESINEFFYDELQTELKDSPLRIFFMDSFANEDAEVAEHYTQRVKPLIASVDYFVDLLKADALIDVFDYNKTNRVKVGVETTNKGNTTQIINDPLNAVEFVSTVTWFKSNDNCLC